jgi:tRNA A37 threonylcarbamoyladenosine dehydratase
LKEVSWYQLKPETSLDFFKQYHVPLHTKVIDIGGGGSLLVDYLLEMGYQNITGISRIDFNKRTTDNCHCFW